MTPPGGFPPGRRVQPPAHVVHRAPASTRRPAPCCSSSTEGVEAPGTGLLDPVDALAARPAGAGDLEAEGLADVLVDDVRRGAHRGDDVAVPVLRAR
ncbi:hypothetical protein ACFWJE_32610 [Streptomyces griseoincarnatus]|nr:hypothetical protein [Streptomyces coelicolor]